LNPNQERIADGVTAFSVVQDRPAHQLDRLLRAMAGLLFVLVAAVRI
jgi:hypothetical protein